MKLYSKYFLIMLLLLPIATVLAEVNSSDSETKSILYDKPKQLVEIKESLKDYRADLTKLNQKIEKTKEEKEKKSLQEKKEQLLTKIENLTFTFEEILTGGVKIADYTQQQEKQPFNWQEEVLSLFKPMMSELKALTANSRAIDALKTQIAEIEEHIPVAKKALEQIREIKPTVTEPNTSEELTKVETEWEKRNEELLNQHKLLSFQLEQKLNPPDVEGKTFGQKLYDFGVGRGLTIVLAFLTFILTFILMAKISASAERQLSKNPNRQKLFFQRAFNIVMKSLTILLALFATMFVLYLRNDWLILGFILIILFGIAWALRQSIPNYIREVKLMLNMGPVREGERVNYQGIPWRVADLNFYTTFENTSLSGGAIKLPVDVVVDLNSRPPGENEGWFPNETGDYVILENDLYGKVIQQTPDIVQMNVMGGSVKTMATTDYLALNPRNLTTGFGIFVTFGLDYDLQGSITKDIPETLEKDLKNKVKNEIFADDLGSLTIEFNQASGSSLDLIIVAIFNGKSADHYFGIRRFFQRATVEICTEHNWNIPFDNVTVHLDKQA